jgi:nicotinamide mononucleotide transporter
MDAQSLFDILLRNIFNTTYLEIIAVTFGMVSVWLAKKENILVYPVGIISVLIYVYICFYAKLYADMGINFFYFIVSVYGWYMWAGKRKVIKRLEISRTGFYGYLFYLLAALFFFGLLSTILINYTDSDVPLWDSFTTAFFIIGMWMMARKKIEHWIAWIIGNIVSIPLYFYKGLAFTSFQYLIFLILAIMGYIEWERKLRLRVMKPTVGAGRGRRMPDGIPMAILILISLNAGSCREECGFVPAVRAGANFNTAVDSLSVRGLGREDSLLYNAVNNITTIFFPMNPQTRESGFKIDINRGTDTVWLRYDPVPVFLSPECGFIYNFDLAETRHTTNFIDSVVIALPQITRFEELNLRIFTRPDPVIP